MTALKISKTDLLRDIRLHLNADIKDSEELILEEGYLDSMQLVEMVAWLEEKFGIQPQDEDMIVENFESVDAIYAFIVNKTEQ